MFFLFSGMALFASETFDSQVLKKEEQKVYGSGTLSTATMNYAIWVMDKDVSMKIEVPKKAFDILKIGDVVRITFDKGLFFNEIKKISLVRAVSARDSVADSTPTDTPNPPSADQQNGDGK
jgi:hypothetical protein